MKKILLVRETPRFPKINPIFEQMEMSYHEVNSIRKANNYIKSSCPDLVISEFFYAYGNNYSGIHISNLDMLFVSLQKYQCSAKVITFVDKSEEKYIDKLINLFPLDCYFVYPVATQQMHNYLREL